MRIRLNHTSHMKGASGMAGQEIDADDKAARVLIARGGAVEVAVAKPEAKPKPIEKATAEPEAETAVSERGRRGK